MHLNSKIYVAGHNGLVGSAIVRKLKSKGYKTISSPWFSRSQVGNIIGLCFTTICNSSNVNDNNSKFRLGQVLIQFKS